MGKTILELFKEKPIRDGNQTAEQYYSIRDSKGVSVRSRNALIDNTGFAVSRMLRKTLGVADSETFFESEGTGLRIIQSASQAILYGNELNRITLKTTPNLDLMKGSGADVGLVGRLISKISDGVNSKLGIPQVLIPTRVSLAESLNKKGQTQNRMIDLAEIRKSGEGSVVGKFLKQSGGGNFESIGVSVVGNVVSSAKDFVRGKLFGTRSVTPFDIAEYKSNGSGLLPVSYNYGSIDNNTGVVLSTNEYGNVNVAGLMYSKTFTFAEGVEGGGIATKTPPTTLGRFNTPTLNNIPPTENTVTPYSSLFVNNRRTSGNTVDKNGNITPEGKFSFSDVTDVKVNGEGDSIVLGGDGYEKWSDKVELTLNRSRISSNPDRIPKFKTTRFGMESKTDIINAQGVYSGESKKVNNKALDDYDIVPLKFYSIAQNKTIQFRNTITGLSETVQPNWESSKFAGSPFSYHTYSSVDRTISFNFKIFSLTVSEHINNWNKLNMLSSLAYPQGYYPTSAIIPPFIKFTLGVMYKDRFSFISSLSYTFDEVAGWHIDDEDVTVDGVSYNTKNYKLPRSIDVGIGVTLIESRANTQKKYYSFEPQY